MRTPRPPPPRTASTPPEGEHRCADLGTERLQAVVRLQQEVMAAWQEAPGALMQRMSEGALRLLADAGATGAWVAIAEGDEMVYRAGAGGAAPFAGMRLAKGASLVERAYRSGKSLVSHDTEQDPRVDLEACRRATARSLIVVPLEHGDRRVGVLTVHSSATHVFGEEDVRLLELSAGVLGSALARAEAQAEVRRLNAELAARARSSEARLTDALEHSGVPFCAFDRQWRFVTVNRAAEGPLRRAPGSLLGRRLWSAFPGTRGTVLEREFRRAVREQVPVQFEFHYAPGGFWTEVHAYPAPEGLAVFFLDVTARHEAEEEVARSEARFRSLVEATTQVVWRTTPDGVLMPPSASWCAFTGQRPEELEGTGWLDAVHPDDRERAWTRWREAVERRHPYLVEYRLRRPDGSYTPTEARGAPVLGPDGEVREWVGTNTDISERHAAQEHEQRLLGIVGHDLRSPLAAMKLGVAHLLRTSEGRLGEAQVRVVRRLEHTVQRMERLAAVLMDYTRSRAGQGMPLRRQRVQLRAVLDAALEEASAASAGVRFLRAGCEELGAWVDPERLVQAVGNLLENAARYGAPGAPVTLVCDADGDQLAISVHNAGAPIPPELMPRLFQPFVRGAQPTSTVRLSTGLGLYIVREVAHAHGGDVVVRSSEEAGTTFTLRLPRFAVAEQPAELH